MEPSRLCLKTIWRPSVEASPMRCRYRGAIESGPEALLGIDGVDASKEV